LKLFLLEEVRDRRYNEYAMRLQRAFRRLNSKAYYFKLRKEASDIFYLNKERRSLSINRKFYGNYISGMDPSLLIGKRENIEFAQTCFKYDRQFHKQQRDLVLTNKAIYIIGKPN
jgi:myosin-1